MSTEAKRLSIALLIFVILGVLVALPSILSSAKSKATQARDRLAASATQESHMATPANDSEKLQIVTTQEGTGAEIVEGNTISVWYTGALEDGTVFDSNALAEFGHQEPFSFTIGEGRVIQGWEQGLLGAKVGEKRTLTIPPALGYGASGAGNVIPPNATLIFDVEVISIK